MWNLLCIFLYFNSCHGSGLIKLIPTNLKNHGLNFRKIKWETISLSGTDKHEVSFGYKDRPYIHHQHRDFPKNSSPPFSAAETFFSIKQNFSVLASITSVGYVSFKNVDQIVQHFHFDIDFVRDGKTNRVQTTSQGSTLTLLYRMTCDPFSKGLLCELCRTQMQHPRFFCLDNGTKKVCKKGFSDPTKDCNKARNPCDPHPCLNGGKCMVAEGTSGHKCQCGVHFVGKNCSDDVDECKMYSPCQNGGTCKNWFGGYECQCSPQFRGINCSDDITLLFPRPGAHDNLNDRRKRQVKKPGVCQRYEGLCRNGGTCIDLKNKKVRCVCALGYKGERCKEDVDECLGIPCKNGGTCRNLFGGYKCYCRSIFTGRNCTVKKYLCFTNSLCENGGRCISLIADYKCNCLRGFQGKNCSEDVNECEKFAPCLNNGVCHNTIGSFRCECPARFIGSACQYEESNCMKKSCLNKGTCEQIDGRFFCKCRNIYQGDRCGQRYGPCSLGIEKCQNNGTCKDTDDGIACKCPNSFEGKYCQLNALITGSSARIETDMDVGWNTTYKMLFAVLSIMFFGIILMVFYVVFECWSKEEEDEILEGQANERLGIMRNKRRTFFYLKEYLQPITSTKPTLSYFHRTD